MKFNPTWNLKWISSADGLFKDEGFSVINQCVLLAKSASGGVQGFTVFEPRNLNEQFFERLDLRRKREEYRQSIFYLYLPVFLKHRFEVLNASKMNLNVVYTPFVNLTSSDSQIFIRDKVKVVSVDDSPVLLKFLKHTMDELGFFDVMAQISKPTEAVDKIIKLKPDMVTLDIQMPGKTGVEVLRDLLGKAYFPVLMISSLELEDGSLVFEALNSGAFEYLQKPKLNDKETFKNDLLEKCLLAVLSKESKINSLQKNRATKPEAKLKATNVFPENLMWCLGASTGGTQALTRVFTSLPTQIPPTLVVQHIPPIFSKAFADSLAKLCPFVVKEAQDGDYVQSNHVYIAPGGLQMGIEAHLGKLRIVTRDVAPVNRFKPSVDYLFSEVAKLKGIQVVAGVLTGMGRDGAAGLLELKKKGAQTFVQDEESSTVYGMPRAAIELGATENSISLDSIAQVLLEQSFSFNKVS